MTRALVIGGDGLLGRAVAQALRNAGVAVSVTSRRGSAAGPRLDLTEDLSDWRPPDNVEAVICAAGLSGAEACGRDPDLSARLNRDAPRALAKAAGRAGARFVFFATDAAPEGNVYAQHKRQAEADLRPQPHVTTLFPGKVIPPDFPLFVDWITRLRAGRSVTAFADFAFAPIAPDGVGRRTAALAMKPTADRIWRIAPARTLTYADAARRFACALGVPEDLVHPHLSGRQAPRLSPARLVDDPPEPEDALDAVLAAQGRTA